MLRWKSHLFSVFTGETNVIFLQVFFSEYKTTIGLQHIRVNAQHYDIVLWQELNGNSPVFFRDNQFYNKKKTWRHIVFCVLLCVCFYVLYCI